MNENRYKEAFKAVAPSEEAVERIYEVTTDKKKFSYKKIIRRVAAAAMAFMLVLGGGFGIDYIAEKFGAGNSDNTLGIYIAYGSENELVQLDSKSAPPIFCRYYIVKNKYSEEKQKQIKEEYERDFDKQANNAHKFDEHAWSSFGPVTDKNGEGGKVYSVTSGTFFLDIKDYSKVDKISIEDTSQNGKIEANLITKRPKDFNEEDDNMYITPDDTGIGNSVWQIASDDNPNCLYEIRFNNKVVITGDELKFSQESGLCTLGVGENKINTGYSISWNEIFTLNFYENIDFNITKVKGSIVFTVDYIDGTTEQSTVNYHFDKDGYMILSMK